MQDGKTPCRNGTTGLEMKTNDLKKLEERHQRKVSQMIESADLCWVFAQDHPVHGMDRGVQIF